LQVATGIDDSGRVAPLDLDGMESKLAKDAEKALIEATQRLCPEERLNAFLQHCRLTMQLFEAGQELRLRTSQQKL